MFWNFFVVLNFKNFFFLFRIFSELILNSILRDFNFHSISLSLSLPLYFLFVYIAHVLFIFSLSFLHSERLFVICSLFVICAYGLLSEIIALKSLKNYHLILEWIKIEWKHSFHNFSIFNCTPKLKPCLKNIDFYSSFFPITNGCNEFFSSYRCIFTAKCARLNYKYYV